MSKKYLIFDISEVIFHGLLHIKNQKLKTDKGKKIAPDITWFDTFSYHDYLLGRISKDSFLKSVIKRAERIGGIKKGHKLSAKKLHKAVKKNVGREFDKGMINYIKTLKKDFRLGIYSDHGKKYIKFLMKKRDLNVLFNKKKRRFFSYELKYLKQHPYSFKKLKKKLKKNLKCKSSDIIYIDNQYRNIAKASRYGIKAIQFSNREKLEKDIRKIQEE